MAIVLVVVLPQEVAIPVTIVVSAIGIFAVALMKMIFELSAQTEANVARLGRGVARIDPIDERLVELHSRVGEVSGLVAATRKQLNESRSALDKLLVRFDVLSREVPEIRRGVVRLKAEVGSVDESLRSQRAKLEGVRRELKSLEQGFDTHLDAASQRFGDVRSKVVDVATRLEDLAPTPRVRPPRQGENFDETAEFEHGYRSLLVNTVPKSGTYLVSGMLTQLGATDSGLHFRDDYYWDFWRQPQDEVIGSPGQFLRHEALERAIHSLGGAQFAVAHMSCSDENQHTLREARIRTLFMIRDIRDCLVSMMRFMADPRRWDSNPDWAELEDPGRRFAGFLRTSGEAMLKGVTNQLGWLDAGVPIVRFEDLYGDNGEKNQLEAVSTIVDVAPIDPVAPEDAVVILRTKVMGKPNRTFSGQRSDGSMYASDEVLDLYEQLGVFELNRRMGFGDGN